LDEPWQVQPLAYEASKSYQPSAHVEIPHEPLVHVVVSTWAVGGHWADVQH
jgi:hypothetical protein